MNYLIAFIAPWSSAGRMQDAVTLEEAMPPDYTPHPSRWHYDEDLLQ